MSSSVDSICDHGLFSHLSVPMCTFSIWTSNVGGMGWLHLPDGMGRIRPASRTHLVPHISGFVCMWQPFFIEMTHSTDPGQSSEMWIKASKMSIHSHKCVMRTHTSTHTRRRQYLETALGKTILLLWASYMLTLHRQCSTFCIFRVSEKVASNLWVSSSHKSKILQFHT